MPELRKAVRLMELDEKRTTEELLKIVRRQAAVQSEYFELMRQLNEIKWASEIICKRMLELNMVDQCRLLRASLKLAELQKEMCEKYGFEVSEDGEGE